MVELAPQANVPHIAFSLPFCITYAAPDRAFPIAGRRSPIPDI
jgi:hypothetical protein